MTFLKLILRSPSQKNADFEATCERSWTVKQLKDYLFTCYPGSPSPTTQKLIYSGKLLRDSDILDCVFSTPSETSSYTIHFISLPSVRGITDQPPTELRHRTPHSSTTAANTRTSPPPSSFITPPATPTASAASNQPSTSAASSPAAPAPPTSAYPFNVQFAAAQGDFGSPQQAAYSYQEYWSRLYGTSHINMTAWAQWHQQYTMYMQQQMWQMNPATVNGQQEILQQMYATGAMPQMMNAPLPAPAAAPAPGGGAVQPVAANAVANGGGLFEDEDEEGGGRPRDLLDYANALVRVGFLLSIVYFHSNFSRVAMIFCLGFAFVMARLLFRLYQAPAQRPEAAQAAAVEAAPAEVQPAGDEEPNVAPAEGEGEQPAAEGGNNAVEPEELEQQPPVEEPQRSLSSVIVTVITSFVTSLFPDIQPPLNVN